MKKHFIRLFIVLAILSAFIGVACAQNKNPVGVVVSIFLVIGLITCTIVAMKSDDSDHLNGQN